MFLYINVSVEVFNHCNKKKKKTVLYMYNCSYKIRRNCLIYNHSFIITQSMTWHEKLYCAYLNCTGESDDIKVSVSIVVQ